MKEKNEKLEHNRLKHEKTTKYQPDGKVVAFVLIDAAPGESQKVYNDLLTCSYVVEIRGLFGEYDLIAKVVADSNESLTLDIISDIRRKNGISDTKTLTTAGKYSFL
ncbi:MAG: Lrp/AsnC ligand binding domain-containing protein [Nanoarchaeota archaeon]|nr:Lrp/AsnC ligand binding domain-containing protein [Nanoarchaeota archaeon]MBU4124401.1 Lrp/AsnC ligand binding domain-containing protein [Nanoarchaeota archaeon]